MCAVIPRYPDRQILVRYERVDPDITGTSEGYLRVVFPLWWLPYDVEYLFIYAMKVFQSKLYWKRLSLSISFFIYLNGYEESCAMFFKRLLCTLGIIGMLTANPSRKCIAETYLALFLSPTLNQVIPATLISWKKNICLNKNKKMIELEQRNSPLIPQ